MKKGILIVDDVEINREILTDIFWEKYDVMVAEDGNEALKILAERKEDISAILLDIYMPNLNGIEALEKMNQLHILNDIPVLMITADNSYDDENRCLQLGATDFIRKPFSSALVKTRVENAVSLFSYKKHLEDKVEMQKKKISETNRSIVEMLGNLVESRNLESGAHVQRVSLYTNVLANIMMEDYPETGLTPEIIEIITSAAALHDVGKIAISDSILLKPGRLTPEEFEIMKTHTTLGSEYIKSIESGIFDEEYANTSYEIARYHHERYDGRGYPEGLKGDEIPISAQLVSVADVYDALIEERCYKKPIPKEKAYEMIINGECGTFSPKLIECFKKGFPFEEKR